MEVLMGMENELDTAIHGVRELQNRHDRERTKLAAAQERQKDLKDKRLDAAIPYDTVDQQEAIGLSHTISDGESILADLERKISERQQAIHNLTKEKARLEANVLVGEAMSGYDDVMKAFTGPVRQATEWLRKAQEAAGLYARSNPGGFTSVNQKLRPRIETMSVLIINIENGKKV